MIPFKNVLFMAWCPGFGLVRLNFYSQDSWSKPMDGIFDTILTSCLVYMKPNHDDDYIYIYIYERAGASWQSMYSSKQQQAEEQLDSELRDSVCCGGLPSCWMNALYIPHFVIVITIVSSLSVLLK